MLPGLFLILTGRRGYRDGMAERKEIVEVGGRSVTVTNPDKVYFPRTGHTKLDLVRYYLSVADGALAGVAGRPMVLKRFVHGAEGEAFFQKRAPAQPTGLDRHGRPELPVRPQRRGDRPRTRLPGWPGSPTSGAST